MPASMSDACVLKNWMMSANMMVYLPARRFFMFRKISHSVDRLSGEFFQILSVHHEFYRNFLIGHIEKIFVLNAVDRDLMTLIYFRKFVF